MSSTSLHTRRRASVAVIALLLGAALLAACGDDSSSSTDGEPAPGRASAEAALEQGAIPIDVRTPEEYDGGHIQSAQLLDVQSPGFDAAVAELDPDATYVVYCRSGNRSAAAAERMEAAGLVVLDGGALGDMTSAGWPAA